MNHEDESLFLSFLLETINQMDFFSLFIVGFVAETGLEQNQTLSRLKKTKLKQQNTYEPKCLFDCDQLVNDQMNFCGDIVITICNIVFYQISKYRHNTIIISYKSKIFVQMLLMHL